MSDPIRLMSTKVQAAIDGFFLQLPNIVAAIVFLLIAWFAAKAVRMLIVRIVMRAQRPDLAALLGSLARFGLFGLAILFAAAIVFPSVKPGDVFATLGVGSVAVGFAFKDILQNLLAGLLLLIRRPYRRGDQIVVRDSEGTVEQIESRATLIKTYDGRRVIIPNSDVYTSPVIVNTAFDQRRDEYVVGIGYGDDIARAVDVFAAAMRDVPGVLAEPAPEVLPWKLNDSTVDLKLRWWAKSMRLEQVHVRADVVLAVYLAAKREGIDLPFPTTVMLLHDQTEETDGDRNRQREGWPGGAAAPAPARLQAGFKPK